MRDVLEAGNYRLPIYFDMPAEELHIILCSKQIMSPIQKVTTNRGTLARVVNRNENKEEQSSKSRYVLQLLRLVVESANSNYCNRA